MDSELEDEEALKRAEEQFEKNLAEQKKKQQTICPHCESNKKERIGLLREINNEDVIFVECQDEWHNN